MNLSANKMNWCLPLTSAPYNSTTIKVIITVDLQQVWPIRIANLLASTACSSPRKDLNNLEKTEIVQQSNNNWQSKVHQVIDFRNGFAQSKIEIVIRYPTTVQSSVGKRFDVGFQHYYTYVEKKAQKQNALKLDSILAIINSFVTDEFIFLFFLSFPGEF